MMTNHFAHTALTQSSPRPWRGVGIFCCLWLALFSLRSSWTVEDTIVTSTLIPTIAQGHGVDLSVVPFGLGIDDPKDLCFFKDASGRILPVHPIGMAVLSAPIQGLIWCAAWLSGAPVDVTTREFLPTRLIVEKLTASFFAALAVVYLYWTLRLFVPRNIALGVAALYAFSSSSLSVLSQGLWPHTGINLILIYLTYLLLRYEAPLDRRREYLFFLALGLLCGIRLTAIPFAGVFALAFLALVGKPRITSLCIGAAALLPVVLWNVVLFQHILGGYLHVKNKLVEFKLSESITRLKQILFSYHRGLLVFNPFLLFIPWAYRPLQGLPRRQRIVFAALAACIVGHYLLCSTNPEWHGGYTFGPRYMLDVLAPAFLLAGIGFSVIHSKVPRLATISIMLIAAASATLHLFGVLGDQLPSTELNALYRRFLMPQRIAAGGSESILYSQREKREQRGGARAEMLTP